MSNDEQPVPDISISTSKPSKNPLGYTITYHGNGLTFADGSSENEIVVSSSGKVVSGQYKELSGFLGWYSDKACTQKVEISTDGLPVSGIVSDLDLYAKSKTFVLKDGLEFNDLISSTSTSVVFTDEIMPVSATLIDVDEDGDGGVIAWMDGTTMKVSTQTPEQKVFANAISVTMFADKSNLTSIDFHNLDTRNVENMSGMFFNCSSLTGLDLSSFNTSKVYEMNNLFDGCTKLTTLDLSLFDTSKVERAVSMFEGCSSLTSLDLSMLDFSKVKEISKDNGDDDYSSIFKYCSSLTSLKLPKMSNKITNMACLFSGCKNLTELNLNSLDTSNVNNMLGMFENCTSITKLDLSALNTSKVSNMSFMFYRCSHLASLNLSSFNTSNVTSMDYMFKGNSKLTLLTLGDKFSFVGSDYRLPKGTWYSSDGTAYTSGGNTCTIPNNKADTYTRR